MTHVAIVGGGIGGLTAARALSRRGIDVTVHEAAPELKEIGAGVALGPNAMKVLRALGLEEQIRAITGDICRIVQRDGTTGREISVSTPEEQQARFGIAGATVHRADLLEALAESLPAGVVTLNARCIGVEADGEAAVAHFDDGSAVRADIVVGADGIHSKVRTGLFGDDAPRFTGKICYRSVIPASAVPEDAAAVCESGQWLGPHGTIVLYPMRGHDLVNVVCHHDDDAYRHESWVAECSGAEVTERYATWNHALLQLFEQGETWYKWALYDRDPIPRWTSGRATLLGDAAHPMLPYLGQGACQAIEDGIVLAAALAAAPTDPAAALARYERARRPRASAVVLAARARGESNHLVSPLARWRRDVGITVRRRLRGDADGRGMPWIPTYDASAPDVLAQV